MIRSSFAYGAFLVLLFTVMTILYLHWRPRCSDQVISEAKDPGGHWIAAVMEARCGEDQPFFTHVNLRPATDPIQLGYFSGRASDNEIFLLEQDAQSADVKVEWTATNRLAISCAHCPPTYLRKHFERWGDVTITYAFDIK